MEQAPTSAETVAGYTRAGIEHELFGASVWGEVWLGDYETGSAFTEHGKKRAIDNVNVLVELLISTITDGQWAAHIESVSTGRCHWDSAALADLKAKLAKESISPGALIDSLLYWDYDIEGEPEDGSGWVEIIIGTVNNREIKLCAEGHYWSEYSYTDADGKAATVSHLCDQDILSAEESGALVYTGSNLFWKSEFAARSCS